MKISMDNISRLYDLIKRAGSCSFLVLQNETHLKDTELCLSICSLIKDNKIRQRKVNNDIVYEFVI